MRIAVTGGSGFIGAELVKKLIKRGEDVVILDINSRPEGLENVEYNMVDITDLEQTKSALKGVDIVYHLAGTTVDPVRSNPYLGISINVTGTQNVLESCRLNNIKKILFASSFYVYDGIDEKLIVNEESALDISKMELFGAIKYFCESMIKSYAIKYGLKYVIFRFGSVYGPDEKCSNIIRTMIQMAQLGDPMEIWGEGKRRNQYTFVEDIVKGCILGIDKNNEIYNLISPEETSTGELGHLLRRKYNFEVVFLTERKEGPSMAYMHSRKAVKELGWNPTTLNDGIEKTIEAMKA
jgi:UDP-glucose 4-epimerase